VAHGVLFNIDERIEDLPCVAFRAARAQRGSDQIPEVEGVTCCITEHASAVSGSVRAAKT
jgi:hypothetical protein